MYTVRARPRGGGASTQRRATDTGKTPCGDGGREQRTQAPPGTGRSRDRSALGAQDSERTRSWCLNHLVGPLLQHTRKLGRVV